MHDIVLIEHENARALSTHNLHDALYGGIADFVQSLRSADLIGELVETLDAAQLRLKPVFSLLARLNLSGKGAVPECARKLGPIRPWNLLPDSVVCLSRRL